VALVRTILLLRMIRIFAGLWFWLFALLPIGSLAVTHNVAQYCGIEIRDGVAVAVHFSAQ
jgi:hypothetical protein